MVQGIEKTSNKLDNFRRPQNFYNSAREAFGELLDFLQIGLQDKILVPAYIGWSKNEGSGVFDPIEKRAITPIFYHLDRQLNIDIVDCMSKIEKSNAKAILLIHYFGFVDVNIDKIVDCAKAKGMLVIEDAAHALYSDQVGGFCGRYGDFTIYSLHKMLPYRNGGVLVSNTGKIPEKRDNNYSK